MLISALETEEARADLAEATATVAELRALADASDAAPTPADVSATAALPSHTASTQPKLPKPRSTGPSPNSTRRDFVTMGREGRQFPCFPCDRLGVSPWRLAKSYRGRDKTGRESAGHCRILGSCAGSAYMGGQPRSIASGRSS
jgi:hypothetical protein